MNLATSEVQGVQRWTIPVAGHPLCTTEDPAPGDTLAEVLAVRVGELDVEPMLSTLCEAEQRRSTQFKSPHRRHEYIASRWLVHQFDELGPVSISHCRRWIVVGATRGAAIGVDVESRLPRHVDDVAARLHWGDLEDDQQLQAWTLWESWRKLAGGSVLDEPDAMYRSALAHHEAIMKDGLEIDGVAFRSLALPGGCLSLAVRP